MNSRQNNSRDQALQQASLALQMQQFDRAKLLATDILKSNRTDRSAVLVLAHALMAQDRHVEAIGPLERVMRRNSDAEIETLLGAVLCGSRRSADGIEQLQRTAARRPPYLPAFQELAGQLSKAGQLNEAIRTIEDALALAPESIDLKVDLGRLLLENNDRAKARDILIVARDAAPGRPDILTELGRALLLDGDYAAAADAFRHALGLRPQDPLARANLAACLLEMGERNGGETALRSVIRGRPQMLGRAAYALSASSHGRFFFRPSAVAKFLGKNRPE
ncbi:tetratricopeptide repeat protein [Bradyrhizobium sp. AUGA SZCCT0182]|uniref:tetratricopeptide repeat protein n=1 Tax=Bradyrhizobium sp. AUGA SZCCT0182 TaxID=2807667 RepID=UPI001BA68657|nr:tetratricopeptide repeat protein [Bradyrhizobium sp. AUGA SZCCT0182]MBR1236558.1 tetratricopeptide repeat protein [Bradyrhizobium sp. AUGA SZCCT0182]